LCVRDSTISITPSALRTPIPIPILHSYPPLPSVRPTPRSSRLVSALSEFTVPQALTLCADLQVIDAGGKWISSGIVHANSHPEVPHSVVRRDPHLPFVRPLGRELCQSSDPPAASQHQWTQGPRRHVQSPNRGGVSTAHILPGSANNIDARYFVFQSDTAHSTYA
ncbi:hypothetical protein FB451DRAFT_1569197, partial [Mycena latifolia]